MPQEELRGLVRHVHADRTTPIDGVLISQADRSDPSASSMSGTVLAVIAQVAQRLALGDRVFEYGAGQYLVASVDLPVTGQFTGADPENPRWASDSRWTCPTWPSCGRTRRRRGSH